MSMDYRDFDFENLAGKLPTLLDYADENPQGQQLWRMMGSLRDPKHQELFTDMIADFRSTAAELRDMATQLEQAAAKAHGWLRSSGALLQSDE